jgi:hypothetical protein
MAWWILISWFLAVLGSGLLWVWWPVLDGAIEIFYPRSDWFNWPFEDIFILALAIVALLFHAAVCSAAFMRRRSWVYVALMLAPIGISVGTYVILYPSGMDRVQKRVDSFQLGARWAVKRAGGATKVREDALVLLASTPDAARPPFQALDSTPSATWPKSFHALHAIRIEVNEVTPYVDVVILPTSCFADTFGYIIMSEDATEPDIKNLHDRQGHRLWKIADGIYLYEEW